MDAEKIIEADVQRSGVSTARQSRFIVNRAIERGAQALISGKTLFILKGNGEGRVQFMWFTADDDVQFVDNVNKLLNMLKKAKAKSAFSVYSEPQANDWFTQVDKQYRPKVGRQNNHFKAEMRL